MWGDESEAVAPIISLYQIVDAQKGGSFLSRTSHNSPELCPAKRALSAMRKDGG